MDFATMTDEGLKARWLDQLLMIETSQRTIQAIQQELASRQRDKIEQAKLPDA